MKAHGYLGTILLLCIIRSDAQPIPSLMLHPPEINRVMKKRHILAMDAAPIVCKGIVYINNNNWTVWLDNIRVTPALNPTNYLIEAVSPTQVVYRIKGQNQSSVARVGSPLT